MHIHESTFLAVEEHRARNERYRHADKHGLFRRHRKGNPQLLTRLGNQIVDFGKSLHVRSGLQTENRKRDTRTLRASAR